MERRQDASAAGVGAPPGSACRLETNPFRGELDSHQLVIAGHVQRGAVITKGNVGGGLARHDRAKVLSLRRQDEDAAGTGGEQVPPRIDFHSIKRARTLPRDEGGAVEERSLGSPFGSNTRSLGLFGRLPSKRAASVVRVKLESLRRAICRLP